jgi:hypothetical protein
MRSTAIVGAVASSLWACAVFAQAPGRGGVDHEALRAVFPGAERFASDDVLLTEEMAGRLDELARARVRERMVTFYTALRGKEVLGYAVVQSHVVRTKRETLLLAFEPDGRIRRVTVLAFLEPVEYRPSDRWLGQLDGKGPGDRLAVGDDLTPITGSTLTARGVAEQSRWLLQALKLAREKGPLR